MKKCKLLTILLILICFSLVSVKSQVRVIETDIIKPKRFSKFELQSDFRQLVKIIEDNHPGMYEFTSKDSFNLFCEQQHAAIKDSSTIHDFYTICSSVVAKIGSGHSGVAMPEGFFHNTDLRFFPAEICWNKGRLYVIKMFGKEELIPGSEIVSINNRPASEIYKTIYNSVTADGYNPSYISGAINQRFYYLYSLHFGFPRNFMITYKNPTHEKLQEVNISPIEIDFDINSGLNKNPSLDTISLKFIDNNSVAVLRIPSFEYRGDRIAVFKRLIDRSFSEIYKKGIKNLILDLRGNDGGDPFCSAYLLSYIIKKPTIYLADTFSTGGVSYDSLTYPISPIKNCFKYKPYILIDGLGFSSTGHIAALIKYYELGIFVGEELGSTYITTGNRKTSTLNSSKPRIGIAGAKRCVAAEGFPKNRGILPDYEIKPSIKDLIDGKDVVLEYATRLIEKK